MPCKEGLGNSSCLSHLEKVYKQRGGTCSMRRQIWRSFCPPGWDSHSNKDGESWTAARTKGHTNRLGPRWLSALQCWHRGMSPRRRGRTQTEHQGLLWGWADSPQMTEPQKAEFIIRPHTPGLPAWAPSLAAPVLRGTKRGGSREEGGWSSLGAGRTHGQQGRVSQGTRYHRRTVLLSQCKCQGGASGAGQSVQ